MSGAPLFTRYDPMISCDWGDGSPHNSLNGDHFSVRWMQTLSFETGVYRFFVEVDDGALVLDAWQIGSARAVSVEMPLTAGRHTVQLDYFEHTGVAQVRFWWERKEVFSGWKAEYYSNRWLEGDQLWIRDEAVIDFDWGEGSPAANMEVDSFSVRWQRSLALDGGRYRFRARMDDGVRVWINNHLVIDDWQDGSVRSPFVDVDLSAGSYSIRVEYYEHTGFAQIRLQWQPIPSTRTRTPTATATFTRTPTPTPTPTATRARPTRRPTATATAASLPEMTLSVILFDVEGVTEFRLDWTAPETTAPVTGYRILRQRSDGDDGPFEDDATLRTLVADTGSTNNDLHSPGALDPAVTYTYQVIALAGNGPNKTEVALSNTASDEY